MSDLTLEKLMDDEDLTRDLPGGRLGLSYEAFLALIPTWPDWIRVDGLDLRHGPESGVVFHTRHEGRRFAISTPRTTDVHTDANCMLYTITDFLFNFSWSPIVKLSAGNLEELRKVIRNLRRELPIQISHLDLTTFGQDGELDPSDRVFEGAQRKWKRWIQESASWDHDHCQYCWATFSQIDPAGLTEGYAIQGGKHGDDAQWRCRACVDKRRGLIHFEFVDDELEADS